MSLIGGRRALRLGWGVGLGALVLGLIAAQANAHIYWTSQGSDAIGRARLDGSVAIRDFISTAHDPRGVAIDGAHVYWAQGDSQGSIGRARLNGSEKDQAFITTGRNARGVALDSFGIYWSHVVSGAGAIGHAGLDGSNVNPSFIPTSGSPCGLAVDPDKIWWANSGIPGTIGRAHGPLDVEPTFITAGGNPCGVAATATHVYWANRAGNGIGRARRDGTHVRQHFIATPAPCGVAVNGSQIYWTSAATNTIGTARLDGTVVNPSLIKNVASPCGIAVDPTATAKPSSYSYPPAKVGQAGRIHAFFVKNTSSSVLDVRRVKIDGPNAGDFKKTGDGCTIVNTAAGGGCVINVRFAPTAAGQRRAVIQVISNASNSPTSITVTGSGVAP